MIIPALLSTLVIINVLIIQTFSSGSRSSRGGSSYHSSSSHTTGSLSAPWRNSEFNQSSQNAGGSNRNSSQSSVNQPGRTQHVVLGKNVGQGSKVEEAKQNPPTNHQFLPPKKVNSSESLFKSQKGPWTGGAGL